MLHSDHEDAYLRRRWWFAGRLIQVTVLDAMTMDDAQQVVEAYLSEVDRLLDPKADDGPIATLAEGAERMPVPELLAAILGEALDASELTQGYVQPTAEWNNEADEHPWRSINVANGRISLPAGPQVELQPLADALVADWAADAIARFSGGALVSIDSNLSTAGTPPADGWQISMQGQPLTLHRRGLSRVRGGRDSDAPWSEVTVAAATCARACSLANAAFRMGREGAGWLAVVGGDAVLRDPSGEETRVGGWQLTA